LEGVYTDISDGNGPQAVGQTPYSTDNKFGEKLTYDVRGNITSLIRNGMIAPGTNTNSYVSGNFGVIDNLAYVYGDSNRVKRITDGANTTKGFKYAATGADRDYDYDKNGNLVADRNKGITRIVYNYMNLPQTIEFTGSRTIEFIYDATGMKLRKTVKAPNVADIVTDYMDGFEYKNGTLDKIHHAEGYVERLADGSFMYNYTLKDHLGNTRVTFADANNNGTIEPNAEINQINHYAPFGMNLEGNWNGASPDAKNKYQYNDKELQTDFGLNLNDYGARFYDAAIGKFTTQDRFSEMYNHMTPYQYAANNPIKYIDVNGDSIPSYFHDKDGNLQNSVPSEIQQMFLNEYGINVGYNAETHMLYDAGGGQTDNPISSGSTDLSCYLGKENSPVMLETGFNLYYQIAGEGNKKHAIDGAELVGDTKTKTARAVIDLADFDAKGQIKGSKPNSSYIPRSFNLGRAFEHEFWGHGILGIDDETNTVNSVNRVFSTIPEIPARLNYSLPGHKIDFSNGGIIKVPSNEKKQNKILPTNLEQKTIEKTLKKH
jgi:RHS repeat-associated protein